MRSTGFYSDGMSLSVPCTILLLSGLSLAAGSTSAATTNPNHETEIIMAIVIGTVIGLAAVSAIIVCVLVHVCREKKRKSRRNRIHAQHGQTHLHNHMSVIEPDMYMYGDLPPAYAPRSMHYPPHPPPQFQRDQVPPNVNENLAPPEYSP